jgi:hypothetical protein
MANLEGANRPLTLELYGGPFSTIFVQTDVRKT